MQETWTIQGVLNWTIEHFGKKQVPDARLSAELLLAHVLHCKRLDLYLQFERILTSSELAQFRSMIKRRVKYEPVQYILGEHDFMGLTYKLTPAVLIPRPETELLVEEVLRDVQSDNRKKIRVLDVGTGSGVIAISIAGFCSNCAVTAVDISSQAIEVARGNAARLSVENVEFHIRDAKKMDAGTFGKFEIIVANPPYIAETQRQNLHPQVRDYEPLEALFAGAEGMDFYKAFIPVLPQILEKDGVIYMEIGFDQKEKILALLRENKFKQIKFIQDYQKINRIVKAQI